MGKSVVQHLTSGLLAIAFSWSLAVLFALLSGGTLLALASFAGHAGLDPVASSLAAHATRCLDFGAGLLPFQGSAAAVYHPVETYNLMYINRYG